MPVSSAAPSLFLVRHARAGSPRPGERDIDRALDETGTSDAGRIAVMVRENGWSLGDVVCSPARRCRQTAEALLRDNPPLSLTVSDVLYTGTLADYVALVQKGSAERPLTLVAHNPLIEQLVWECLGAAGAAQALPEGCRPGTVVALARLPERLQFGLAGVLAP